MPRRAARGCRHPVPVTSATSVTFAWARRNAQTVTALALYGIALGFALALEFIQDTWLAVAGGRDIAHHGLPWHERLTIAAHGQPWVDQQWLGKLFLYFMTNVGGVRLLAAVHIAFVLAALLAAVIVARRRGASDAAVFWVVIAVLPSAPWGWQLRSQILAYSSSSRCPHHRDDGTPQTLRTGFSLCAPLLVLWANMHGSVTLGAVLVAAVAVARSVARAPGPGTGRRLLAALAMCLLPLAAVRVPLWLPSHSLLPEAPRESLDVQVRRRVARAHAQDCIDLLRTRLVWCSGSSPVTGRSSRRSSAPRCS